MDSQDLKKPGVTQPDGVREAPEVLDNAESADASTPQVEVGTAPGVPLEPDAQKIARLEEELDRVRDQHLRLAAEFDNFRKRIAKERLELADRAQAAFVLRLLDVLDDLDRLVAGEAQAAQGGPIYDATVLINRKLRKELEAAGLERIEPTGQPFDPANHEAVSTIPAPQPEQSHLVSATFQTGYSFKGNLVRPARVQVYTDSNQG